MCSCSQVRARGKTSSGSSSTVSPAVIPWPIESANCVLQFGGVFAAAVVDRLSVLPTARHASHVVPAAIGGSCRNPHEGQNARFCNSSSWGENAPPIIDPAHREAALTQSNGFQDTCTSNAVGISNGIGETYNNDLTRLRQLDNAVCIRCRSSTPWLRWQRVFSPSRKAWRAELLSASPEQETKSGPMSSRPLCFYAAIRAAVAAAIWLRWLVATCTELWWGSASTYS